MSGIKESTQLTKQQLLVEIEDPLRTMPSIETFREKTEESLAWTGRVSAVIEKWDYSKTISMLRFSQEIHAVIPVGVDGAVAELRTLLHQARHDLLLETLGPVNVAVPRGLVFDYFDEIRKIIELAKVDLLFVDPYLDAEFVPRYLPHISTGVTTRLLAHEKLATLLPAVDMFTRQTGRTVEVRSAPNFHDRYIFVDRTACYQSGASFKDGAKSAPTTLTQITDAFEPVLQTYENLWSQAHVER